MELILCLIGLVLSFLFAGSETAYVSTNKFRLEIWIRKNIKSALRAKRYFDHPDVFLSTTLVGNNLSNVLASSFATVYLIAFWDETISWAVITFTILTIGEIIPKVFFRIYAHILILNIIYLIEFFHFILKPLIVMATYFSNKIIRLLHISKLSHKVIFDKSDISVLLQEAQISGAVDANEQKIISRVLNLPDTLVREAMIPRTAIKAIDERAGIEEIRRLIYKSGKTKIPVFRGTIDNIIGIVFMFDIFNAPRSVKDSIRPVCYVPENKRCNELLSELQASNNSIAIVIDEYGGTAGIITIEDLVEELFGEIEETTIKTEQAVVKINKTTWRIKASESIDYINDLLDVEIPEGDYETIAGFLLTKLGRIPEVGEKIAFSGGLISVVKASENKIIEVRLVKKNS